MRLQTERAPGRRALVGTIRNVSGSIASRVRFILPGHPQAFQYGAIASGDPPIDIKITIRSHSNVSKPRE